MTKSPSTWPTERLPRAEIVVAVGGRTATAFARIRQPNTTWPNGGLRPTRGAQTGFATTGSMKGWTSVRAACPARLVEKPAAGAARSTQSPTKTETHH